MFSATSVLFLHRRHLQMPYRRSGRSCPAQNPYAAYNTGRNHAVHKSRPDLLSSGRSYRFPVEAALGLPAYPAHPEVQPVIPHIHKYPHNNEPNGGQAFSELPHSRRTWTYDLRYTLPSQVPALTYHLYRSPYRPSGWQYPSAPVSSLLPVRFRTSHHAHPYPVRYPQNAVLQKP